MVYVVSVSLVLWVEAGVVGQLVEVSALGGLWASGQLQGRSV